ncbi:VOC family protein [Alkalicoccobacillus plakortidis]|uniref:VOC family protein n=1 Tax=Alkalicoccobacillus plakortidis TaxID=444060 RepID=A0ABT0XM50_9BACI|nr:VOC family protein [Alkalicoccobacillus plakortidis]MCM2676986.1 VOC family protein [Alkalicoccobacillus plakortidis]
MIHHIELYVSDLKRSTDFWGWLLVELGYQQYQKWDEGISWKSGHCYIVFVQVEQRFIDAGYHRKRIGLNHLAFWGESKEHVDKLTEQLKQRSVSILYTKSHPYAGGEQHYAVYFEDPDRMKVEVVAP